MLEEFVTKKVHLYYHELYCSFDIKQRNKKENNQNDKVKLYTFAALNFTHFL